MSDGQRSRGLRRRTFLASVGTVGVAGMAGCNILGGGSLDVPTLGDSDAAVTVEVFDDYACPHCARYSLQHFPRVLETYVNPGEIHYEHYDFPIPVAEPESWRAANAARYVYEEVGNESFWQYNRGLFTNQSRLGPDLYAELATAVGADGESVRTAAVDQTYEDTVQSSRQRGIDKGVQGTPAIFVDGEMLDRYDFGTVSAAIDAALSSESG